MTSGNRIVSAQVQTHAVMARWPSNGPLTAPLDGPGRDTQPSATALRDTGLRQDLLPGLAGRDEILPRLGQVGQLFMQVRQVVHAIGIVGVPDS